MIQKKKILLIDPADFIGGAEIYTLEFLETALKKTKTFSFSLVTTGYKPYLLKVPPSIRVYKTPLPRIIPSLTTLFHLRKAIQAVVKIARKERTQLLLTNTVRAHIIGSFVSKKIKKPIIWNMHDFTFPKWILSFFIRYPTKVICVSHAVKSYVFSCTKEKFHHKIVVIPNGIDDNKVEKMAKIQHQLPLKKNEFWVGIIGRIAPWKGQQYFIEAAEKVLKTIPNARFFIIGTSSEHDIETVQYEKKIRLLVQKRKLSHKIFFMGFMQNIYPLVRNLDLVVHSSIEPEPFGRVLLDAMVMQKPVIASPMGGTSDIIIDGENGYLIDPRDTTRVASYIIDLSQASQKRYQIGRKAYERVQEYFLQSTIVKQILVVFKSIL